MSEKIPHDRAAEGAILAAVLTTAGVFDRIVGEGIAAADFYDPRHRVVFSAIEDMHGAGVDPLTLCAKLREQGELDKVGGVAFVSGLLDAPVPDIARVEQYARLVKDCSNRRRYLTEIDRLRVEAARGGSMTELAQRTTSLCSEIARGGERGPDSIRTIARRAVTRLDERMTTMDPIGRNIAWPIDQLNVICNGIPRGVETILGARVRVGKTAAAISTTIGALNVGRRVLLVEMDMSEAMIGDRFVASLSGVSAMKIRTGRGIDRDEQEAINQAARAMGEWGDRLIVDTRSRTIAGIAALIRREARDRGLDLVIIDHVAHVRGGRGEKRYEQLGDVSACLIEAANDADVALLSLAQLGRDAEQREPTLGDLRESGNLEQDARIVVLLDRPGLRDRNVPLCQLKATVAKNEGEAGHTIEAHFDLRGQRISDRPEVWCAYCPEEVQRGSRRPLAEVYA